MPLTIATLLSLLALLSSPIGPQIRGASCSGDGEQSLERSALSALLEPQEAARVGADELEQMQLQQQQQQDELLGPQDSAYNLQQRRLLRLGLQHMADKIRSTLTRYVSSGSRAPIFVHPQVLAEPFATPNRIQTRSSDSETAAEPVSDTMIGKWLESTLVDTDGFKRSDRLQSSSKNGAEGATQQQQQQRDLQTAASQQQQTSSSGPALFKTLRNIQPVFVRNQPRYGKRAL